MKLNKMKELKIFFKENRQCVLNEKGYNTKEKKSDIGVFCKQKLRNLRSVNAA